MATANTAYAMFEGNINQVIEHWEMDGKVTKHDDYRNRIIGVLFKFRHRYLHVRDVLAFDVEVPRKNILDDTVRHIKEIKDQFNYYFNAIWC